MDGRRKLKFGVLVLAGWLCSSSTTAQQIRFEKKEPATRARRVFVNGLRTERLTAKELQTWEKIRQLVFLTDAEGQPWHRTLVDLWTQLENSGHAIYIELMTEERRNNTIGGVFRLERFDPRGRRHVAVIRLYLAHIRQAYVGPAAARANGFIPFEYLDHDERYVEVLGHELAHAVWILTDLPRAERVAKVIEQTNEIFLSRRGQINDDPEMLQRLYDRDLFIEELEIQAEAVEAVVWHELLRSKGNRTRSQKVKYRTLKAPFYSTQPMEEIASQP